MGIEQTSLQAFESIKLELGKRQEQVYTALKILGEANNLMISRYLGLPINSTTPRVLELRNKRLVGVSRIGKCPHTRRNSIFWRCVK